MLKEILQSKETRLQEKVEKHLKTGIEQLQKKMYNGAMVEFGKAMDLDLENVYPVLLKELENAASSGELEAALAVGLNMLKYQKDDPSLAIKLGNYARRNKDYKQAKSLYQTALKIDKKNMRAFYNLAAADAKSNLYDDAAINAVNQFKNIRGYVLPSYVHNINPLDIYGESAKRYKAEQAKEKLHDLTHQKNLAVEEGNPHEVRVLDAEIDKINKGLNKLEPEDIFAEFRRMMESDEANRKNHCFNLCVFALENSKPDIAEEALTELKNEDFPTIGLLKAIILDQKGQREEAVDQIVRFLGENENNRYYNVNLGLIYRKSKNNFLAVKYLIKTADLLRVSNGLYNMYDLKLEADSNFKEGNLKKALEFYVIAATEIKDPSLWIKMGHIYRKQEQMDEAVVAYKRALDIDPDAGEATAQLQGIHEMFVSNGDNLMEKKKFSPAVTEYEKALRVFRIPDTLKKAASGYRQLNSIKKANELLKECEAIENAEKSKEMEKLRTALVIKAKMMMKQKQYQQAIEFLETAFEMKLDKNIYAQLTMLYKKFKGKDSLLGLEKRWNDMLIAKERAELEEREKLRESESGS